MIKSHSILIQLCPRLSAGGVERGTIDIAVAAKNAGFKSIVISGGGFLEKELKEHQIQHIQLPIYSKNPIRFISNLFHLKKLFKELQPNIVHPHSRIPTWLVYLLSKQSSFKWLTSCNGIHSLDKLGLKKIYNGVLIKGPKIITNSEFTKKYLVDHYPVQADRIQVIYRGIDLEKFNPNLINSSEIQNCRDQWSIAPETIAILLPGRLCRLKGQHLLIEAAHRLKTKFITNFVCLLVGNDQNLSYVSLLKKQIQDYGLEANIIMTGESQNLKLYYAASDIILSTSIQPEAFGRTIVEAQLMKKPIIASAHGGACETIIDGKTGWLFTPSDAESLANTILKVVQLPKDALTTVVEHAAKEATRLYSKEKMCGEYLKLYEEL